MICAVNKLSCGSSITFTNCLSKEFTAADDGDTCFTSTLLYFLIVPLIFFVWKIIGVVRGRTVLTLSALPVTYGQ